MCTSFQDDNSLADEPPRYGRKVSIPDEELRYYEQDFGRRARPKRRRRKGTIAIVIVVVVVLIASALVYSLLLSEDGNTPEDVFWQVIEALNETDGEKLSCCTTWFFEDEETRELLAEGWEQSMLGTSITITVHSHELLTDDYEPEVEEHLSSLISHTETAYGVSVAESCVIIANCTTSTSNPFWNISYTRTEEMVMPIVKIETMWYMAMPAPPEPQQTITYKD